MDEGITRIVKRSLADHAEALAGRAAENDIDGLFPMREWSRMYLPSISATLRQMAAQSGKLNSCVAQWMGSYSTAAATSNPACSKPRLIPPAPANRSTPIGFFPLALIKRSSASTSLRLDTIDTSDSIANRTINQTLSGRQMVHSDQSSQMATKPNPIR